MQAGEPVTTEPRGATALAALLSGGRVPAKDERVVIVCGGNANPSDLPFG
jgi:threonine dehydratase